MAVHQHSTIAPKFPQFGRPLAPARILIGGDFVALLESRANIERTIERLIGGLDDFDAETEDFDSDLAEADLLSFGGSHV